MKAFLQTVLAVLVFAGGTLTTQAQTPILNSLPTASAVILLDFDGHYVNGTSWNYAGAFNCNGSGLDASQITTIFNRMAEDYRPFNVNITTDPAKFVAANINKRTRCVFTTSYEWSGPSGGIAYIGSFTWGDDSPCFVFTNCLQFNIKNIAEAGSHEVGHTLGLQHMSTYNASCVKTDEYHYGQGSGEIGWAPIMGAGYYQNLTLWHSGKSSESCDSIQNDLTIITTQNSFGYRADDHQSSFTSASTAAINNNQFIVNGIIERNNDQDMIKFTRNASGRFQLNAIPYNVGTGNSGSDLDMQVTLFNSSQQQLAVYNPGTLLSSVIDTTLNAGTYYLRVEGKGNIYAPAYASLGSYSLQGTFGAGALPLHRLELQGELVSDKHRLNWIVEADEAITEMVVEISTDGRNFTPLTQTESAARSFMYKPYVSTTAQYRLHVTFDNGRSYYSNIVALRNTSTIKWPTLVSNIATGNVAVNSPGTFSYVVYEFSGKTISRGRLTSGLNTINTAAITSGTYLVRFSNDNEQWVEKFVKQ